MRNIVFFQTDEFSSELADRPGIVNFTYHEKAGGVGGQMLIISTSALGFYHLYYKI